MQIITNQFQKEVKKHGADPFPFLVSYETLSNYESGTFLWHWHPEIEITYVQKGSMIYQINHHLYHLKEGEVLFGNSGSLHTGKMENLQDCSYISITFDPKLIYGFFQSAVNTKFIEPLTQNLALASIHFDGSSAWHHSFIKQTHRLISLDQRKTDFYELDVVQTLISIWKLLLIHHPVSPAASVREETEYERIKEILLFIEQNYSQKITLSDIAAQIHLCESECCRLFKRCMNLSLFSYLQEYRIERSLEYLNLKQSIQEAAERTGFSDSNYYSKVFRKIKGCSPRQYCRHTQLR